MVHFSTWPFFSAHGLISVKTYVIKIKIGMSKIFALEKKHKIDRKIRLKSDKIKKIFT